LKNSLSFWPYALGCTDCAYATFRRAKIHLHHQRDNPQPGFGSGLETPRYVSQIGVRLRFPTHSSCSATGALAASSIDLR
jgi:hypothetical protein